MIENIDAHLETGLDLEPAIIQAANQIVVPTFVSTLCICIVWLPLFQLSGIAGYLFLPLAEAIIFAMLASFILSRTFVPTMAAWLLRAQVAEARIGHPVAGPLCAVPCGLRAALRALSRWLSRAAHRSARAARGFVVRFFGGGTRLISFVLVPLAWEGISSRASSRARSTCISRAPSVCAWKRQACLPHWSIIRCGTLLPGHVDEYHRQLRSAQQRHQPGLQRERDDRAARL